MNAGTSDPLLDVDPWVALMDGRSQLLRAIDGLDEAGAARRVHDDGDWTVADLITHVADWDEAAARCFRALAAGERAFAAEAAPAAEWAEWNAARVAASRTATLEARVARLQAAREAMLEAAAALDAAALDATFAAPWGVEDTPRGFLVAQAIHDGMHAEAIAAALAR